MVLVDDEVADGEVGVRAYLLGVGELAGGAAARFPEAGAGNLRVRQDGQALARVLYPGGEAARRYDAAAPVRQGGEFFR